jgi:outer membrane protein OmpA-like peptidoglycan-associated protein
MKKTGSNPFNPFIVLSDVTISTLVLLACLLMLFSAVLTYSTVLEKRKKEQAQKIKQRQEALFAEAKQDWPKDLIVLNARGLQSYLFRFADRRLFDPQRPHQLSPLGQRTLDTWGRRWAQPLRELQKGQVGPLVEIQVQGHCSRNMAKQHDPWTLSVRRAMIVARRLQAIPGFPAHLLSVAGYSWHRRAFLSSNEARRKGLPHKPAFPDRVDILLIFAGDQYDNNYVAPWDGRRTYGPSNDVSRPDLTDLENIHHGQGMVSGGTPPAGQKRRGLGGP